ncbi:DNase I-like protein, partial [Athelia psychrophila]
LNQVMREERIAILGIQEAHLTQDFIDKIKHSFDKRLHVEWSQGTNPNKGGIAFVINKELMNINNVRFKEVIPGRAAMLTVPWNDNKRLRILNIYAPNDQAGNANFWKEIPSELVRQSIAPPSVILGDFNIVEDSIDRLPNRIDNPETVTSLREMRTDMNLLDGWRTTNPTEKNYTHYAKGHGSHSRLDRIYTTTALNKTATDWTIEQPAIKTDHKMVTVRLTNPEMPYIGRGRWTMQIHIIKNKRFMEGLIEKGIEQQKAETNATGRTETNNSQTRYKSFKDDVIRLARKIAKEDTPKILKRITQLEQE